MPGDSIDNPVLPLLSRTNSSPPAFAVTEPALDEYTCSLPSGDEFLPTQTVPPDVMRNTSVPRFLYINFSLPPP